MSLLQVDTIRNRSGDGTPLFDRGISVTGVITSTSIKVSSVGIGSTEVISSSFQLKNITSIDSTTLSTLEIALEAAPNNFNSLYIGGGGISTFTGNVYVAGITTVNNDLYVNGNLFSSSSGASLSSLSIGSTQVISSSRELQNITSLDSVTTATIESAIVNTPNIFNDLVITGISTFTNGPILVGTATSTSTTNQRLQVTGGAYVSGNLGIGTTNPTSKLTVIGDALITGTLSALNFSGITTYSDKAGIATYAINAGIATYATSAGIATNVIGGRGSISQLQVSGISTFIGVTEFKDIVFAEQDLFVTDYFTANQVAIGTLTNIADVSNKSFGRTLNIGNDLIMYHLNQPAIFKRSNWIISDEYDLLLGTKSEGSVNVYSALIGIQTGNGINPGNTAEVFIGYGNAGAKLTTTGYGVSVTGSLSATNSIGIGTTNPTSKLTVVGDVSVSGVVTAISFVGTALTTTNIPNLSGDITSTNTATTLATVNSNIGTFGGTDAIPVVTVNAKGLVTGISTVAPNNGTLTLAVSGTGLSGSASFTANQSGVSTFTIDSNATSANTNSTIVARDGSGGFVAGIITATSFSGTATSTTNIPNLSGAITSNNTTTSLGSFTSTNLAAALTDETGSGSAVFATSPTLVTPILGAASATSIVVSSGSTFTNGPILVGSGTSTGTESQPLQVTGGAYVSGNVGVGTTNPTSALTVSGDGSFTGVVTATEGFISVGNTTPIQISLIGNQLTFTAFGIGSTTLILS